MQQLRIITLLALICVITLSCSKDEPTDPCDNIICLNGDCINGNCDCDEGWTGIDCTIPIDPCIGIMCNNGNCINGICDCDEGWQGPDCSERKRPSTILINNIFVTDFPEMKPDGTSWDINGGRPDLRLRILNGNALIDYSEIVFPDASTNDNNIFVYIGGLDIGDIDNPITIELQDGDPLISDVMGSVNVRLYNPNQDKIEDIIMASSGSYSISVAITFEY